MKKTYYKTPLLTFCALFLVTFLWSQNTVGNIFITNDVDPGYTLYSIHEKTFLINNCGEKINEWDSDFTTGHAAYLREDGTLLRAGRFSPAVTDVSIPGNGGIVEIFDWNGNRIWHHIFQDTNSSQHHEVYPMPNGNILVLIAEIMSDAEVTQAGRDQAGRMDRRLYNEKLIEIEPIGTNQINIVWEWSFWDHLIQDFDSTKDNFGTVSQNPGKLDINFLNGIDPVLNWLHINSAQYDAQRDQIVLSSRLLSEIYVIDHSTTTAEAAGSTGGTYGKGGDFLYRWGNPQAYDRGSATDRTLYGQHTPYFIPTSLPNNNKLLLFNNGFGRTPFYSQVDMLSLPESPLGFYSLTPNAAYGPLNTDRSYNANQVNDPDFESNIVSNAQQLPNGNWLINEGRPGWFFEIDSNDNIVWQYQVPVSSFDGSIVNQGSAPPAATITFRAIKYPTNYAAFTNLSLTPGSTVEGNGNTMPCDVLSTHELEDYTLDVYPNPTRDRLHVKGIANANLQLYNATGIQVLQSKENVLNMASLPAGVYWLRIIKDKVVIGVERIIKQ